ncbi:MAG: DUF2723 domain-containing protein [Chloroflexota bacterium]
MKRVIVLSWQTWMAFSLLLVGGLAAGRILFELFFPRLLWLGRPFPIILFALIIILFIVAAQSRFTKSEDSPHTMRLPRSHVWLPLLLNLAYLFNPDVDLVGSRLCFGASLWFVALLFARQRASQEQWRWLGIIYLLAALLPIYLLTMPNSVGRADTFEFQVVAPQLGIVHPTGYPLYLLLGKLFTLLPVSSVAWRLNFGTMVYGLSALSILYLLGLKLSKRPIPSLLAAIAVGLTPTFWSQAIEAEVYTLHGLIVMIALWQIITIYGLRIAHYELHQRVLWLAATIGLGLTNHLTSVFLLPAAGIVVLLKHFAFSQSPSEEEGRGSLLTWKLIWQSALAFILPLLLYAYLPIRWAVVNSEPMGLSRFVDWVVGGRFQDALQWMAWLNDPARYGIVWRLYLSNLGSISLVIAFIGLAYLIWKRWQIALLLGITWFGYSFYALNYYVPDLEVFIVPGHLVIGLWWGMGITAVLQVIDHAKAQRRKARKNLGVFVPLREIFPLLLFFPILLQLPSLWTQVDRSGNNELLVWGEGVLAQPLAENAAILADSEKIAPLYYLQQAEGVRPDLDIMVLPDEAAYRAELNGRLTQNQPVYLARFLPGLEGIYHLSSAGPLTEVRAEPLTQLPEHATVVNRAVGPLTLLGYELEPQAAIDPAGTAVTLYWQALQPVSEPFHVYIRWQGDAPILPTGQHPANNDYPTVAWKADEIVPDFHLLPQPVSEAPHQRPIEVALALPFTPIEQLEWHAVTTVDLPATAVRPLERPLRTQLGPITLNAIEHSSQVRPHTPLPIILSGHGTNPASLTFHLQPATFNLSPATNPIDQSSIEQLPFLTTITLDTDLPNGRYHIIAQHPEDPALCGWLASPTAGCIIGEVEISGVALPPTAINFDDKIALLNIDIAQTELQPGGLLDVTLTWQGLAPLQDDYTVFIQVLDENDTLVGQVDAWPLQGTFPTSQWQLGQTVTDPYLVQLAADLPPGDYRLQVGFYLLATLQRLPVLDAAGQLVDDKFLHSDLYVP